MKNCWKENSKERPKFVDIVASLEAMKNEHFDGNVLKGRLVVNKSTGEEVKYNKAVSLLK